MCSVRAAALLNTHQVHVVVRQRGKDPHPEAFAGDDRRVRGMHRAEAQLRPGVHYTTGIKQFNA